MTSRNRNHRSFWSNWLGMGLAGALFLAGCGASEDPFSPQARSVAYERVNAPAPMPTAAAAPPERPEPAEASAGGVDQPPASSAEIPALAQRKIIYNAQVDLVVENLSKAESQLMTLVQEHQAYVSETNVSGQTGSHRQGSWKIRVPVEKFAALSAAVAKLGELQRTHTDSQDVTQEFFDVEARIKNKLQEEKRLQKILEEAAGKLKEILEVEKEITRVRGEVELMQGRLRYLASLSSLSTITVTISEIKNFIPAAAPTFAQRVGRTFEGSLVNLGSFLEGLVMFVVAIVPWLAVVFPVAGILWLVLRRRTRLARAA